MSCALIPGLLFSCNIKSAKMVPYCNTPKCSGRTWHTYWKYSKIYHCVVQWVVRLTLHGQIWVWTPHTAQSVPLCTILHQYCLVQVVSSICQVLQGVRQGEVLSTWMYLLFINELLGDLEYSPNGTRIGPLQIGYSTLADDFTIVSSIIYSLQEQMNTVTKYANMWGYELN